ncbi:HNH endonuclease [Leuconostoc citreum]
MSKINGDWYHSRTGSQLSELAAIQLLVEASNKSEFIGKTWSSGRKSPNSDWIYNFSSEAKYGNFSIQPSTMQTKIRNWIRLGFLEDQKLLPLKWTQLGNLWNNAVLEGKGGDANLLYQLIIANALGTVSFGEGKKVLDFPEKEQLILPFLLNKIKIAKHNELSKSDLETIIDGDTKRKKSKNYSYWITDLVQSGLFEKLTDGGIKVSTKYPDMVIAVKQFVPKQSISAQFIKSNPLNKDAPFREALIQEFIRYGSKNLIDTVNSLYSIKINISEKERKNVVYFSSKQKERTTKWAKKVKKSFQCKCAIPECDAEGVIFIQAAHIMPFNIEDPLHKNAHRNDEQNGIALCLSCHRLFDAGLFTFDEYGKINISNFIYSSNLIQNTNQSNVMRLLQSKKCNIIPAFGHEFAKQYTEFHNKNIFLGE